jgi:type I restriction enzyme M protein
LTNAGSYTFTGPKDPITTKSELLFIWLLLDLLETKGRGAVIVPEGVLFGSTKAHKELRRQLLFEHNLQAVISLPPGVFQPYSGVKTSILVFQKIGETPEPGKSPYTDLVWFYEVRADGYTLDAKRYPQPDPNDLWDALAKYPQQVIESQDYYQPELYTERWRVVDAETVEIFRTLDAADLVGKVRGIHELFCDLLTEEEREADNFTTRPKELEERVKQTQTPVIEDLFRRYALTQLVTLLPLEEKKVSPIMERAARDVRRWFNDARHLLDTDFEQFGYTALKECLDRAEAKLQAELETLLVQAKDIAHQAVEDEPVEAQTKEDWQAAADDIVRELAKLDGFNVDLRTVDVRQHEEPLDESRSWTAPVRAYARDDEWQDIGTHDEQGKVRPEYIAVLKEQGTFEEDGTLKAAHLDVLAPDCIEANDFNLSAGRYKPFVLEPQKYEPPAEILRAVRKLEMTLISGIDNLLTMIGTEND